jgi:hypothetical protein
MELSPGAEKIKIHGEWVLLEQSPRGHVFIRHPDGRSLLFEMSRDLKEYLSQDPDPEFKAWRTEMKRLRKEVIQAARKTWRRVGR